MTEKRKTQLRGSLFGLTASGKVLSCTLAFAGCLSMNIGFAVACCVTACVLSVFLDKKILTPEPFLIVPLVWVASLAGVDNLPLAVLLSAVLFAVLILPWKNGLVSVDKMNDSIVLGMLTGLAFSVTALMTTFYFGIGATGSTVLEMLKNYRYLGFHPNWRGVFYGTITLFAMITYPFKFKKLSKYLPPEVVSIAIPFVLNLLLNPDAKTTPILELGAFSSANLPAKTAEFIPLAASAVTGSTFAIVAKGAFALTMITGLLYGSDKRKTNAAVAGANTLNGVFSGIPTVPRDIKAYGLPAAAVAVAAALAVGLSCPSLLARIPLHSLAVVLIVPAWQRVPFGRFSSMFRKEKLFGVLIFAACVASFIALDICKAMTVCVVLLAALNVRRRKTK